MKITRFEERLQLDLCTTTKTLKLPADAKVLDQVVMLEKVDENNMQVQELERIELQLQGRSKN